MSCCCTAWSIGPLRFSMAELRRFPSVRPVHFIECAGNAGREHRGDPGPTAQLSHGLETRSEWSGDIAEYPLRVVRIPPSG